MNRKIISIIAGIIVLVGAGSFYGGMAFGQSKPSTVAQGANNLANLTPAERQARFQQFGAGGSNVNGRGTRLNGGGLTAGEITAKDDKSVTVKLLDGSSKIIFFSDSTRVSKTVDGSAADLGVGEQVAVSGTANADGSISAQTIQLRPDIAPQP